MRAQFGLIVLAGAFAAGCGQESTPPATARAAAPGGYLGALAKGQQSAIKGVDLASLNQSIQLFNVQEGHYPKDLKELVTQHYLGQLPAPPSGMKLAYDPAQGKVSVVPQ